MHGRRTDKMPRRTCCHRRNDSSGRSAPAQTFQNYRCDDGNKFVAAFYPYDARAYLQIDGAAVTLGKRLALAGSRYSGGGVTLKISKAGVAIKHGNRPAT